MQRNTLQRKIYKKKIYKKKMTEKQENDEAKIEMKEKTNMKDEKKRGKCCWKSEKSKENMEREREIKQIM